MFDIGWGELLLIGVVALIVIGPKELPGALRTLGQWMGKLRRMASEFQGQFQEAMREAELADGFRKQGLEVYAPDVDAFRVHAQKVYLASDEAKEWPKGMLEKINALIARLTVGICLARWSCCFLHGPPNPFRDEPGKWLDIHLDARAFERLQIRRAVFDPHDCPWVSARSEHRVHHKARRTAIAVRIGVYVPEEPMA